MIIGWSCSLYLINILGDKTKGDLWICKCLLQFFNMFPRKSLDVDGRQSVVKNPYEIIYCITYKTAGPKQSLAYCIILHSWASTCFDLIFSLIFCFLVALTQMEVAIGFSEDPFRVCFPEPCSGLVRECRRSDSWVFALL